MSELTKKIKNFCRRSKEVYEKVYAKDPTRVIGDVIMLVVLIMLVAVLIFTAYIADNSRNTQKQTELLFETGIRRTNQDWTEKECLCFQKDSDLSLINQTTKRLAAIPPTNEFVGSLAGLS